MNQLRPVPSDTSIIETSILDTIIPVVGRYLHTSEDGTRKEEPIRETYQDLEKAYPRVEISEGKNHSWGEGISLKDPKYQFHGEVTPKVINSFIKHVGADTNQISDGYHTFGELYEHRIELFIALCRTTAKVERTVTYAFPTVWRSNTHSDGTSWDGWFLMGMGTEPGKQITYHLPLSYWDNCNFADTLDKAPTFDGHTSQDVLQRLKNFDVNTAKW